MKSRHDCSALVISGAQPNPDLRSTLINLEHHLDLMELLIIIGLIYAYRIDPDWEWGAATSEERERCVEVVVDQQLLIIADDGNLVAFGEESPQV